MSNLTKAQMKKKRRNGPGKNPRLMKEQKTIKGKIKSRHTCYFNTLYPPTKPRLPTEKTMRAKERGNIIFQPKVIS